MLNRRQLLAASTLLFIPITVEAIEPPVITNWFLYDVTKHNFPGVKICEKCIILTDRGYKYIIPFFKCKDIAKYREDFKNSLDFVPKKCIWFSNGDKHALIAFSNEQ